MVADVAGAGAGIRIRSRENRRRSDRRSGRFIVIDAVIDVPWARERFKTKPDDFFIAPAAIADEAWHIANQPRSAWSFNVELRPFGETW